MSDQPCVRAVVVDYDGGDLVRRSVGALLATDWPADRFEVVVVDNGSRVAVEERLGPYWGRVSVIRSAWNRGFAGGNNLALADLDGVDAVALVNNDVTVDPSWLRPLVDVLFADSRVGAVCPKLLLDGTYRRLDLATTAERPWPLDRRPRGIRLLEVRALDHGAWQPASGVRLASGFYEPQVRGGAWSCWSMPSATLYVPAVHGTGGDHAGRVRLVIDAARAKPLELRSGAACTTVELRPGVHPYEVELAAPPIELVNNVGTVLLANGYAADRGWLEPDEGQFDAPTDVWAWSGGAVLLRADYLRAVGLFDERLFLYYEDFELAWRGRRRGWRYRYAPASVARHLHAATAVQDSPQSRYYNERNRLLVLLRHASWTAFAGALGRFMTTTLSYVRRDLIAPPLRGGRPDVSIVAARLRALGGFVVRAPGMLRSRWRTAMGPDQRYQR